MGCTSSAPNMVTPKSNTAEKSIQFEGDMSDGDSNDVEEIIYRAEDNEKNVLPSCDTLTERIHNVVRNKSTPSLLSEKDHCSTNSMNNKIDTTTAHHEEKIPKLEQVVVKVVELHNIENVDETHSIVPKTEGEQINEESNGNNTVTDDHSNTIEINVNAENNSDGQQRVENAIEAISPSHSESSRATRWEALADIAAELPASLAVDPITGQIYALSK